jgi:hypothetical protein
MRVIIIRHPNAQVRAIKVDKGITENGYISKFSFSEAERQKTDIRLLALYDMIVSLPLVNEAGISKHEISITIEDGFENFEKDWEIIENAALKGLFEYLEEDFETFDKNAILIDDRRSNKVPSYYNEFESEDLADYTVNITALKRFVDKITIPHDFRSHKEAWRNAIVIAKENAERLRSEAGDPTFATDDANVLYWQHELEVFDAAFTALAKLGLPED